MAVPPSVVHAVRDMGKAIAHRGPNGYGEHIQHGAMLAMRRLSIIDIAGGNQPLYNEDQTIAVVANGEIYNHKMLRSELETDGHVFRSRSDCETIVHAYEKYGDACVSRLRGMFAFAIHDTRTHSVLLARDRLGEKPLYLAEANGFVYFSSELRALLASQAVPCSFDSSSLFTFFHYGYIPEPHTAIAGIRKLPAGSCLSISISNGGLRTWRYWSLGDTVPEVASPSHLGAVLDDVTRFITAADVPVGIALSGGLDSGAIAMMSASRSQSKLHAFTVGYDEETSSDETADARQLAEIAGLEFHSIRVQTQVVVDSFPETIWLKDDPNNDIAGPGYLAVMRAAQQAGVPVLLIGQGADELFWGYPWLVEAARRSRAIQNGLGSITGLWATLATHRRLPQQSWQRRFLTQGRQLLRDAGDLWKDACTPRSRLLSFDTLPSFQAAANARQKFFGASFLRAVDQHRVFEPMNRPEVLDVNPEAALIQLICDTYLRENGLAQADRLSMAASVEVRVPFVDYRIVELAYAHQRAAGPSIFPNKDLLRAALQGACPQWLLSRPKKGFTPPTSAWHSAIHRRYAPLLKDGMLVELGVVDGHAAAAIARDMIPRAGFFQLGSDAIVLELWCRQCAEKTPLAMGV